MFKLLKLSIIDHPFLGKLDLDLVDEGEEKNGPYTTIIIGKNGTGKSLILRIIADLMEDIRSHFIDGHSEKRKGLFRTNFICEGVIFSANRKVEFAFHPDEIDDISSRKVKRKFKFHFRHNESSSITFKSVAPSNISVNSYLVNDKFRFERNEIGAYYIYLGLRNTANSAGTKSYLNRIIPLIAHYVRSDESLVAIKNTLKFLEFNPNHFEIIYTCRYKKYFFHGNLSVSEFHSNLNNWSKFSKREEKPRYYDYFEKRIKKDKEFSQKLVHFLNRLTNRSEIRTQGNSKVRINILESTVKEVEMLQALSRLDLISSPEVVISKEGKILSLAQTSSGEFHFFMSILGLLTNIHQDSLVLIDEPEISFHPNWQLKYVHYLRTIFKSFKSCHFVIATHSHFIISDLDPKTSSIVRVVKNSEGFLDAGSIKEETYGLSAEEILYRVFELRSYRNYYFEIELRELLHLISYKSKERNRIQQLVENLRKVELDKNDPLTLILTQADEYLSGL